MKRLGNLIFAVFTLAAAGLVQPSLADERPPPGAMALSMVLTGLEQQGYTPIIAVSLEDGRWEVEAFKEGKKYELKVDPNSGEILESSLDEE